MRFGRPLPDHSAKDTRAEGVGLEPTRPACAGSAVFETVAVWAVQSRLALPCSFRGGSRTPNATVNGRLLYQLSYPESQSRWLDLNRRSPLSESGGHSKLPHIAIQQSREESNPVGIGRRIWSPPDLPGINDSVHLEHQLGRQDSHLHPPGPRARPAPFPATP